MLAINGRFLAARQSGVQRVAKNLVQGWDGWADFEDEPFGGITLQYPKNAPALLPLKVIAQKRVGQTTGQLWEQLEFGSVPKAARLINLCNSGPMFRNSAVTMIHDAQTFTTPESYSRAFVSWYALMLPQLAKKSDLIVTVSEFSREQLIRYRVAPGHKIEVIPNGVDHIRNVVADTEIVAQMGLIEREFVLAFGSPQAHKNTQVLIKAFNDKRLANTPLVLVGHLTADQFKDSLQIDIPVNIKMAGPLDDRKLRALMEAAGCIAHPSLTEGFGLPPLEAMLLGCPAIVARAGALPEVCGAGALYADPYDVDEWVRGISQLMEEGDDRAERVRLGVSIASNYTWAKSARLLRGLIASRSIA
jgi:glycosyltransferase involved in cell wall biosynthesis